MGKTTVRGRLGEEGVETGRLGKVGSWGGKEKVREGGEKGENDWGMYRKGEKGEDD